ncbi:phosphoenolpyruvate carboxykinase [Novosphingobium sp. AAP1]|nr:phosphoenolpyruvate carboxykinase [Novosphingobium sp. AAP1]
MAIRKIEADGNTLVIRGKIFGAMPMVARLTPAEARAALRLLDLRTVLFLLTLLFRRN